MNRRIILGILLALVLIFGVASVGIYAYNLGVDQGIAQSIQLSDQSPGAEMSPYLYYRGPFFYPPFGFPFFGCFGPFFFFFLFFVLFRGFLWGGRWGHGPGWKRGHWDGRVPPMFEEWHRQSHRSEGEPTSSAAEG
ncbi:MAG: hypothetical protein KDI79_20420 [Anaerolineae bacterium]|nr:hypothetical protein [Anaerolineae bacterium]